VDHLVATQRQTAELSTIWLSAPVLLALRANLGQIGEALAGGRVTRGQASQLGVEGWGEEEEPEVDPPRATFANQTHAARTANATWGRTDGGTLDLSALAREVTLVTLCALA